MTHLYLADSLVTFLVASPLYLVTLLVISPILVHSGAVPIPVHIDDEYIAKFYQYGYQVEDTYTGKHTTYPWLNTHQFGIEKVMGSILGPNRVIPAAAM